MAAMKRLTTAAELLAELDDLPPASWIASDADGTLWNTDVAEHAWEAVLSERALQPAAEEPLRKILEDTGERSRADPYADARRIFELYLEGRVSDFPILSAMALCFAGYSTEAAKAFAERVARERIAPHVFSTSAPLLAGLQERGHKVLVVSGSPTFVVEGALALLDLPKPVPVYGVTLAEEDGVLQPAIVPPITWNAGKVEAIAGELDGAPLAVALGDSHGDLELLQSAQHARLIVHPRPTLLAAAAAEPEGPWLHFAPAREVGGALVTPPHTDVLLG